MCSFCLGEKLRLMQQSPYSAYDELHAETLEYINQSKSVKPMSANTLVVSHFARLRRRWTDRRPAASHQPQWDDARNMRRGEQVHD